MRAKQLSFLPKQELQHGGELTRGRRKTARPLDPKRPVHLVLRSSRAKGPWSLLHPKNERRVRRVLDVTAANTAFVYIASQCRKSPALTDYGSVETGFSGIPSRVLRTNLPLIRVRSHPDEGRFVRRTREGILKIRLDRAIISKCR